jgi:hypothetical protein
LNKSAIVITKTNVQDTGNFISGRERSIISVENNLTIMAEILGYDYEIWASITPSASSTIAFNCSSVR